MVKVVSGLSSFKLKIIHSLMNVSNEKKLVRSRAAPKVARGLENLLFSDEMCFTVEVAHNRQNDKFLRKALLRVTKISNTFVTLKKLQL